MPRHPPAAPRVMSLYLIPLVLALAGVPGCKPATPENSAVSRIASPQVMPATRPVDAAYLLRDRLLAHDGLGFARLAVPTPLFRQLEQAWRDGRSIWPLDELPLDARIAPMLAALQAPNAEAALMTTFKRQFAGADRDIDQAIRTLVVFGGEYVQNEPAYTAEEREHIARTILALGDWALAAPFADTARAQHFFIALCAAARRSGIGAGNGTQGFADLGMTQSLNRLSPFFATLLAQLRQQYGLDLDAGLRGLKVDLMQQTGDAAVLRLRYPLAGHDIDALMPAVRIDGHWYLADFVRRAQASVGSPESGMGDVKPAPP